MLTAAIIIAYLAFGFTSARVFYIKNHDYQSSKYRYDDSFKIVMWFLLFFWIVMLPPMFIHKVLTLPTPRERLEEAEERARDTLKYLESLEKRNAARIKELERELM